MVGGPPMLQCLTASMLQGLTPEGPPRSAKRVRARTNFGGLSQASAFSASPTLRVPLPGACTHSHRYFYRVRQPRARAPEKFGGHLTNRPVAPFVAKNAPSPIQCCCRLLLTSGGQYAPGERIPMAPLGSP